MLRPFGVTRAWMRSRSLSFLASIPAAPADPILGLTEAFVKVRQRVVPWFVWRLSCLVEITVKYLRATGRIPLKSQCWRWSISRRDRKGEVSVLVGEKLKSSVASKPPVVEFACCRLSYCCFHHSRGSFPLLRRQVND